MLFPVACNQSVQLKDWSDVVAHGICIALFTDLTHLFCFIINHSMTGHKGNSEFCFPFNLKL